MEFKVGDKVSKVEGYKFDGIVVSTFETTRGENRIVVELPENGMLHIFNPKQFTPDTRNMSNVINKDLEGVFIKAVNFINSLGDINLRGKEEKIMLNISDKDNNVTKAPIVGINEGNLIVEIMEDHEGTQVAKDMKVDVKTINLEIAMTIINYLANY